jgi:K(+)-stimulated pyrophosphate-energized sodium pump
MTFLIILAIIVAIGFAVKQTLWINEQPAGSLLMQEIAGKIQDGAREFLGQEYRALWKVLLIVAAVLAGANAFLQDSSWMVSISFLVGAGGSLAAGFWGMTVATKTNVRVTHGCTISLNHGLRVAFAGGTVMGNAVAGIGLATIFVLYQIYLAIWPELQNLNIFLNTLAGVSLGASLVALFARVGGGIYTKAADVGADNAGKVVAGLPEDDPLNAGVIADCVGDNVGDVAGMGADLLESFIGGMVGAMALVIAITSFGGVTDIAIESMVHKLVELPLAISAVGMLVSVIATYFVKVKNEKESPQIALNRGVYSAAIGFALLSLVLIKYVIGDMTFVSGGIEVGSWGLWLAILVGIGAGAAIGHYTEMKCSAKYQDVQDLAKSATDGPASLFTKMLALGMATAFVPALILAAATIAAYQFGGLYGIPIAAVGMLGTLNMQLAIDAYGPISDNAGGIAEMAGLGENVREKTDKLDAVGNTTAAIGKGFAIGSAALTAVIMLVNYAGKMQMDVSLLSPWACAGLLVGASVTFKFSALAIDSVGTAGAQMKDFIVKQFEDDGPVKDAFEALNKAKAEKRDPTPEELVIIEAGKRAADYKGAIAISTMAALDGMKKPGFMAIAVVVVAGLINPVLLAGVLAGAIAGGVSNALFQSNAGGAADNAKKYIEDGAHDGKNSEAHKSAVMGDTVGDPLKDTSGPSLNILLKLMSITAMVLAPVLYWWHDTVIQAIINLF